MALEERISKEEYYYSVAKANSQRATCIRRKYGAIIVVDDVIVSNGYNGAPRKAANCTDLNKCKREELKIPSGERYELCRSVHAEMNAIINAATTGARVNGGVLYLCGEDARTKEIAKGEPCSLCKRVIVNAKLKEVHTKTREGNKIIIVEDWLKEL